MRSIVNEHCGKCGYDLTGLRALGECPECGEAYDTRTGQGLRRGAHSPHATDWKLHRLRTVALAAAAVGVLALGGLAALVIDRPMTAVWLSVSIACVVVLAAVTSYLYEHPRP